MKRTKHQIVTLMVFLGMGSIPVFAEPFAKGPYLGQTPPGSTASVLRSVFVPFDNDMKKN